VVIVSRVFEGLGRLERHRLVYSTLGDMVGREIHALALRATADSEW
jgi:BolA protein